MLGRFLEFFVPIGWLDGAIKALILILTIQIVDISFFNFGLGYMPFSHGFQFWRGIVVAGPFVMLFTMIARHQRNTELALESLSRTDDLTGMFNRRTFFEEAERALDEHRVGVLLMLDADHFKTINDTHGHAKGDEGLRAIAQRITNLMGPTDVAGRLGGEEFAVLLPRANRAVARRVADRLVEPIILPLANGAAPLKLTMSIGGVQISPEQSFDRLLGRADEALYAAKAAGRSRAVFWEAIQTQAGGPDKSEDDIPQSLAS